MTPNDSYRTIANEGTGTYREKASKFIGIAFPMANEEAFKERVAHIAREHPGARHVCFAWVLGDLGERHRANDDGEPSGTAGRPILRRIQAAGLTYCGIAVVRYFGGTLLGKAGLVHAYGEAARLAIDDTTGIERVVSVQLRATCDHAVFGALRNDIEASGGTLLDALFHERCDLLLSMPRGQVAPFSERWSARQVELRPDQPK